MLRPLRTGLVAVLLFWGSLVGFLVVTQTVTASIAASLAVEPSSCPVGGFEAVGCTLDGARAAASWCARGRLYRRIRRTLRTIETNVIAAEKLSARGLQRLADRYLGRAEAKVTVLAGRVPVIAATGRLSPECAATIGAAL